ncbi:hypothetical protein N7486_011397 [Penicillium sp. IBT 16267x]|nr:hypothetical protein N7486_011397 [Penicillium sp. IBT 16267x]
MANYPEPPTHLSESHGARAFGLGLPHADTPSTEPEDQVVEEIKRPRACEPCRQLKVRCDPDPSDPAGACKRCAKARRQCIVTAPTRKRQKKTDSRVTELERKIDALTATLQASHHSQLAAGASTDTGAQQAQSQPNREQSLRLSREDQNVTGKKRYHDGFLVSQYPRPNSPSAEQIPKQPAKHWRVPIAGETPPGPKPDARNEFVDVIDRGMIDIDTAQAAFNRYIIDMANDMPFVVFPPGTTMSKVRREKPTLFLAILGVAVGVVKKDIQMSLINESYRLIAEEVVIKGHKTLEIVQALLVVSIWYMTPDNLEELKFYQLMHMAIVVGMELGLNRRSNGDLKIVRIREIVIKRKTAPTTDLENPEARRAWVGCYFLGIQAAIALRRIQIVRWQPYMDESLQILEKHPEALASDRQVIWWAKLGWIMEQAGLQLTTDDTQSIVSFADSEVRYTIKAFANQLAQFRNDIPEELWTPTLAHTYHALHLFVHESAMGVDCREIIFPDSSDEGLPGTTMAPVIEALTSCLNSIHNSFDTILGIDVDRVRYLSTLALARTAYPVVSLIKIYSLITAPGSQIGLVIDNQSLKVEYYLNRVISHYRAAAGLDGGRVAGKFGNIIMMLRNWFLKKRENGSELREIFGAEMHDPRDKQPMRHGNTPLHVLSDLATGDPRSGNLSHQSNSNQGSIYSPPNANQDMARNPTTPATSFGTVETSTHWSSASITPQMSTVSQDSGMGDRSFYQSFTPNPSQPYGMPATTQYPQMTGVGDVSISQPMGMPELPIEPAFDPSLAILGNMMDEGLLSFPFAFDGNFQF